MNEPRVPAGPKTRRAQRRGVALIMVLGAVAVLTVLLTEFQDETSAELASAVADRDSLKAEYMARSAINLSRLLIAAEPTMRAPLSFFLKAQIPVWDFSDRILGAFNDTEGTADFIALTNTDPTRGKNLGLKGGKFNVVIVDEDSKLNINVAARGDAITENRLAGELIALMGGDQYRTMFEQRDRDGQFTDRAAICGAIVDWADADETLFTCDPRAAAPAGSAAEDASYQLLKWPYRRKNAAYDSLEELHLVRGVGDDFWATFVDPDPENPKKRIMTVWGQGAVNVNTANAQTLLAIICAGSRTSTMCPMNPGFDILELSKFLTAVSMIRMFTQGAPLFQSPKDFLATMQGKGMFGPLLTSAMIGIKPVKFDSEAETAKTISTESKMFSIYADGVVPGYQRKTKVRIHAVVDFRNAPPPGMPLLPGMLPGATPTAGANGAIPAPAGTAAAGTGAIPPGGASGSNPNSVAGALMPNPAGTVIYWRME